ncbi:MAG: hypothetical protein ACI8T1_003949 [Verrucomicrobiales bacterium]|jgi:hypothetical protein
MVCEFHWQGFSGDYDLEMQRWWSISLSCGVLVLLWMGSLDPCLGADRPGQLSSSKGKRWFAKSTAPESAETKKGLLTDRTVRRAARREMARRAAVEKASSSASISSSPSSSSIKTIKSSKVPKSADRSSSPAPKEVRQSVGKRGDGMGRRRRSFLKPLFGG